MKKIFILPLAFALLLLSCTGTRQNPVPGQDEQELMKKANEMFGVLPGEAPNPDNAITPEKVLLGKVLFYDARLSEKGNVSCNSCHNLAAYGVDNEPTSDGDDGLKGDRNSPTVLNAALAFVQFWDGRAKDVEEQAGGPIVNPVEMGIHDKGLLEERLAGIKGYRELFMAAFPGDPEPVTFEHVQQAIAAFERTLLTPARFDDYLTGKPEALTEQEKRGLGLFIDNGCTACHTGVLLGGNMYQKFGLFAPYHTLTGSENDDPGRAAVTSNESDKYQFKVPTMRNVAETYPYFHDGSVEDLEEAIRIMAKLQLNKELPEADVEDIAAFLKSLTGNVPEEAKKLPEMPE